MFVMGSLRLAGLGAFASGGVFQNTLRNSCKQLFSVEFQRRINFPTCIGLSITKRAFRATPTPKKEKIAKIATVIERRRPSGSRVVIKNARTGGWLASIASDRNIKELLEEQTFEVYTAEEVADKNNSLKIATDKVAQDLIRANEKIENCYTKIENCYTKGEVAAENNRLRDATAEVAQGLVRANERIENLDVSTQRTLRALPQVLHGELKGLLADEILEQLLNDKKLVEPVSDSALKAILPKVLQAIEDVRSEAERERRALQERLDAIENRDQ